MSELSLHGVGVSYGDRVAVAGIDLIVPTGQIVALLGPSGCGKSSLLRAVAGLERLASGRVVLGGRDVSGLPTFRRGVGMMFAEPALFPHLDVAGNVAFGLRMARWDRRRMNDRVQQMLDMVGLSDRASSAVQELSRGQQQRVALARTIAPRPAVVLLDEPLSALDRVMRRDLAETLPRALAGTTALLVTHDRDEALRIGSRVGVMREGRLVQIATPARLLAGPADDWVARFLADEDA